MEGGALSRYSTVINILPSELAGCEDSFSLPLEHV